MYVFIDESGCAGFKLGRGSTDHFVVAMAIFGDSPAVERAAAAIREVRREAHHKPEFKFSKCSNSTRDMFFDRLCREDFSVRAIVVDKRKIYSPQLRTHNEDFYRYFVQLMLKHDNETLRDARIQIDGSGDRVFRRELHRYLRQQSGPGKIRDVTLKNSKTNDMIQLADMCAGAIHRCFKHGSRDDSSRWKKKLQPRIRDIWTFPNG